MKKHLILLLLLTAILASLQAQNDVYRRFAQDTSYKVAFIEGLRIGDSCTTDVVIILARDSIAFDRLLHSISHDRALPTQKTKKPLMTIWNSIKDHPEQVITEADDFVGNDVIVVQHYLKRVCIYHPSNPHAIVSKALNQYFEYVNAL